MAWAYNWLHHSEIMRLQCQACGQLHHQSGVTQWHKSQSRMWWFNPRWQSASETCSDCFVNDGWLNCGSKTQNTRNKSIHHRQMLKMTNSVRFYGHPICMSVCWDNKTFLVPESVYHPLQNVANLDEDTVGWEIKRKETNETFTLQKQVISERWGLGSRDVWPSKRRG